MKKSGKELGTDISSVTMSKVSKARLCLIVILLVGATITLLQQKGGGDASHGSQPKEQAEGKACCDAPVSRAGYFKEAAGEPAK